MPLRYVDPNKKHGRWYTALESFGRSRPGQFLAHHLFPHIDPWLYRATGGRYPSILGGASTAPLMTTGAKSGQPREHQITYLHDGRDAVATASNYGGPKHPQWYYNLKAHPDRELGGEKFSGDRVHRPRRVRTPVWTRRAGLPGWGDYRLKTDLIGRRIPVFRLKPR